MSEKRELLEKLQNAAQALHYAWGLLEATEKDGKKTWDLSYLVDTAADVSETLKKHYVS